MVSQSQADFERLFQTVARLQVVHSKAELDLTNIESVFAAFEMARMLRSMPGTAPEQIPDVLASLRVVILKTLERTVTLHVSSGTLSPPPPYEAFTKLIRHLSRDAHPIETVAVVTLNYDLAVDFALHSSSVLLDYGIDGGRIHGAVPVLKLHGSLNWGACSKCNAVVPWQLSDYFQHFRYNIFSPETKEVILDIGSNLQQHVHCGLGLSAEPVLVPPTWNKGDYHGSLSSVWSRAASELAEAENVFVVGYSLPDTDSFFRYLYALGTVGEGMVKRFWVFDPDKTGAVKERFEGLLGPGTRKRFQYHENTFRQAIAVIKGEFPSQRR